jgi:hypothetical protein
MWFLLSKYIACHTYVCDLIDLDFEQYQFLIFVNASRCEDSQALEVSDLLSDVFGYTHPQHRDDDVRTLGQCL